MYSVCTVGVKVGHPVRDFLKHVPYVYVKYVTDQHTKTIANNAYLEYILKICHVRAVEILRTQASSPCTFRILHECTLNIIQVDAVRISWYVLGIYRRQLRGAFTKELPKTCPIGVLQVYDRYTKQNANETYFEYILNICHICVVQTRC